MKKRFIKKLSAILASVFFLSSCYGGKSYSYKETTAYTTTVTDDYIETEKTFSETTAATETKKTVTTEPTVSL